MSSLYFLCLLFLISSSSLPFLSHLSTVTASTTFDGLSLIPSPPSVCPIFNFMEESNLLLLMAPNQTLNQWVCPEPYYFNLIKVFNSQLTCVNLSQTSNSDDASGGIHSESFTYRLETSGAGSSRAGSDRRSDDDEDDDGDESFLLWLLPQFLKDLWKGFCRTCPRVRQTLTMLGAVWWLMGMLNEVHDILTTLGNIYRACLENLWYFLLLIATVTVFIWQRLRWRWRKDVAAVKKGKGKKKGKEDDV